MAGSKAITRIQAALAVVIVVMGLAGSAYFLSSGQGGGGSVIDMSIVETDPVNQIDAFNPANITVTHGTTVTLAIQNGDDETRLVQISAFNINQTIVSGETGRVTFAVGDAGVFKIYSPHTSPSAVSNGKPGSEITGYLIVK